MFVFPNPNRLPYNIKLRQKKQYNSKFKLSSKKSLPSFQLRTKSTTIFVGFALNKTW